MELVLSLETELFFDYIPTISDMFPFNAVNILEVQEGKRLEETRKYIEKRIMREQSDQLVIDNLWSYVDLIRSWHNIC